MSETLYLWNHVSWNIELFQTKTFEKMVPFGDGHDDGYDSGFTTKC